MMDKQRRNNLRRVVNQCRKILEDDIEKALIYYGVNCEAFLNLDELSHLKDEELESRRRILAAVEKELVGGLDREQGVKRYIRHTAFTFLNRIAALRAMEVRGLVRETVTQKDEYGGRSLRERELAEANPSLSPQEVLKRTLIRSFEEVGEEIRVLFDVTSEYSVVYPSEKACRDVIGLLTENVSEVDWEQDDIIGWVYQYFNDEARQEYRKAKRNPTPDDIPVISQFYTPHWIVKTLVDNTLGRMWIEMHPESKLKEFCSNLYSSEVGRSAKRVREIRVLDPACGSGHFLVYAFDVLYRMYQEEEPDTPLSEIPTLILENNLFGIDIDLYAVQLAALSLYLKAKKYNVSLRVRKMNLVCADIRVSDGKKRVQFLERFKDDPDLQRIFSKLFEDLGYTYEIGSLLKVRRPFERLFTERKEGEKQARFAYSISGQTELGKKGLSGQAKFLVEPSEGSGLDLAIVVPKKRTIENMIKELGEFEREAIEAQDIGRLLFATEAEKSVGLLALLSEKYDVILMNPPHGTMPSRTKEYARKYYPRTNHDYYSAFLEQAVDLAEQLGFIGALTGRPLLVTKSFQKLREEIFQDDALPQIVIDLGFKTIEEAHARYVALTLNRLPAKPSMNPQEHEITFFGLASFEWDNKRLAFEECLKAGSSSENIYKVTIGELSEVPGTPYAFWAPSVLRKLFGRFPPLDRDLTQKPGQVKIADAKVGLQTSDTPRFTRFWWEIPAENIALSRQETLKGKKWVPFADEFFLFYFYADLPLVVNWRNGGEEVSSFSKSVVRNERFYFRPGLTWSAYLQRTQLGKLWKIQRLPFRILPEGAIFGMGAQGVIAQPETVWTLLAICCSRLIFAASRLLASENKQNAATTASLPIAFLPETFSRDSGVLCSLAKEIHGLLREWSTGDETSTLFIKPWLLQLLYGFSPEETPITGHPLKNQFEWSDWPTARKMRAVKGLQDMSLEELCECCARRQAMLNERVGEILKEIDEEVYRVYGISDRDRYSIEQQLRLQQGESLGHRETGEIAESFGEIITSKEHTQRLISCYVRRILEDDEDGIVPIDEMFPDNLFGRLRTLVAKDFGKERVDAIELEISDILGKPLRKWVEEDFFDFHVSLFRRRPIYWQLTSSTLGKGKLPGVFSCFVFYRKLDKDTIPKIIAFYINPVSERLLRERDRLFKELENAKATLNRKAILELSKAYEETLAKIDEIGNTEKTLNMLNNQRSDKTKLKADAKWSDKAIAEVRDGGWNPIIDHGVKVNIEPLKELRLLHPAADRVR